MRARLVRIGMVCIVVLAAACSSSSPKATPPTTPPVPGSRALVFREVLSTLPCDAAPRLTPNDKDTVTAPQVMLPDRPKKICYALGPTLYVGQNVASAEATQDPSTGAWVVNVHFADDGFVTKVGRPLVGSDIAIIFDHVVQSAPVIREVIESPDVQISSDFDEATARDLANALR